MMFPENDDQYKDLTVTAAEPSAGGGWTLRLSHGWSFFCPPGPPVEPRPGTAARLYGRGIGYVVRGLFLDGQKVFYRTAAEQEEQARRNAEEIDRKLRHDFERQRADLDRRFAALPVPFRARLAKFREANPDFRWRYETYDLCVCESAVMIAERFKTAAEIDRFKGLPWDEQVKAVPLDDGLSENMFGCACLLAKAYLADPDSLTRIPGAMAPLVGSAAYGGPAP